MKIENEKNEIILHLDRDKMAILLIQAYSKRRERYKRYQDEHSKAELDEIVEWLRQFNNLPF